MRLLGPRILHGSRSYSTIISASYADRVPA